MPSGAAANPNVPEIVEWEPYLDADIDVDMAFFIGLRI
jgi:hypothetical protein